MPKGKQTGENMKKKTIVMVSILLGILLIGIVSAGLIDYFGRITGEVTVEGPVFYASNEHPLGGTTYWGLGINDYIERTDPVSFIGAATTLFVSEQLGINSFYAANYEMSIETESDNENGQIDAELWIIEGDDPNNKKELICLGSTSEPVYQRKIYAISCPSGKKLLLDETDRLAWIITDGVNDIHYEVYIHGNTKIEVIPQ